MNHAYDAVLAQPQGPMQQSSLGYLDPLLYHYTEIERLLES